MSKQVQANRKLVTFRGSEEREGEGRGGFDVL
jgi:hypothetical protein